jgi:hypothetical protein
MLTTSANAATQFLLAGGPLVLAFLHASSTEISIYFVTVTAARLPIVFIFGGILSRLLGTFVRLAGGEGGRALKRATVRIAAGTGVVAILGGAVAAAVGPTLIRVLFGAGFEPPGWFAAGATFGVLIGTGAIVLSQVLVGASAESRLPWPWFSALAAAALAMSLASSSPLRRVLLGFVVGEVVAMLGLLFAILRNPMRRVAGVTRSGSVTGSVLPPADVE